MKNVIHAVRVDQVIAKRNTRYGIAVEILVFYEGHQHRCDVFVEEFPAGFLLNLLMNEEISAMKISRRVNGKYMTRFRALPWSNQADQMKGRLFGLILNAVGSDIEAISWWEGESPAVGKGNELAMRLEELLKKDVSEEELMTIFLLSNRISVQVLCLACFFFIWPVLQTGFIGNAPAVGQGAQPHP